jgi:hypothetical protein
MAFSELSTRETRAHPLRRPTLSEISSSKFVEAFVMMHSCLEYAGYALAIFKDPALETVFTNRHVSQPDMTAQKLPAPTRFRF